MRQLVGELERQLILCCIARDADDEPLRRLAAQQLDWSAVFVSSLWHKVAFIVYERLCLSGAVDIALGAGNLHLLLLNHWKQLTKVNLERSSLYQHAAATIFEAASGLGVDIAVSKGGLALFGHSYSPKERKMYDVDFIARREDLRGVLEVFKRAGFVLGEYCHSAERIDPPRAGDLRKHLLQGRGLPNLVHQPGSNVIDYLVAQVRFRVGAGAASGNWIDAEPLLENALYRDGIRVVDWPDLALQLALHIYREANEAEYRSWNLDWNLIKLCDFDRILHHEEFENSAAEIVMRARQLGFAEELVFASCATQAIFPSAMCSNIILDCGMDMDGPDPQKVRDLVWSVGSTAVGQTGEWVALAGSKTT